MTNLFHNKIRQALADSNLQAALDANAEKRIAARKQAYTSLPDDLQKTRQRARSIRENVISHLDEYLHQFIQQAKKNGMIVHHAQDSAEALRVVLELAHKQGATLVAKSKSMVSEEIKLNPALEEANIQVVETDLGEYIVQLRGEPPAHIITPAVHLRRGDVGKLFADKLGIEPTEDIPTLTAVARSTLRQVFLNAQVGISGVNFAVAETGTICILTNEGNGRMVTTLPPTHIALMGIERLVPTMQDLATMLRMLPRSATGQKITVYTSLIHAPRRSDELDGCTERHLVLLDNGRRIVRNSPLAEILFCIRCGACINACPIFREIGGHAYIGKHGQHSPYPGPVGSVIAPGLFGVSEFGALARASSLCGACKEACPVDIDLPRLLLRVRAGGMPIETQKTPPNVPAGLAIGIKFFNLVAIRPFLFHTAQWFAGLFSHLLAPIHPWLRLPAFTGWGYSKDFPRPVRQTFSSRWAAGSIQNQPSASNQANPPDPYSSVNRPVPTIPATAERFATELTALGGHFISCQASQLPELLQTFLKKIGQNSLQTWHEDTLPKNLLHSLRQAGIHISEQPNAEITVGLTGALAGISETGSLVIPSGNGKPLSASLLPEYHLAILFQKDILATLEEALALPEVKNSSSVALVSGPSRTADIEMTLTIGVHGPKEIHVFCVQ